jgi:hypothetical protein
MRIIRRGPDTFDVDMTPGPLRYRVSWGMRVWEWLRRLRG